MKLMRGDMGGAATVVAATLAIAKLKLPVNIITVCPLAENMPGPSATKPGDMYASWASMCDEYKLIPTQLLRDER